MKKAIIAVALLALLAASGVALATTPNSQDEWVASGVRVIFNSKSNSSGLIYLPFQADGFSSEANCNQFIADQNGLSLNLKNKSTEVHAVCSVTVVN